MASSSSVWLVAVHLGLWACFGGLLFSCSSCYREVTGQRTHRRRLMVPEGYVGASVRGVREGVGYQRWPTPIHTSQSDGAAGRGGGGRGGGHTARSYAGVFKNDVPEGLGCWEFADGAEYWGSCCAGAPHGWYLTSPLTSPLTNTISQPSSRRGGALRQLSGAGSHACRPPYKALKAFTPP